MNKRKNKQEARQAQVAWSNWIDEAIDRENDQMLMEAQRVDSLRIVRL